MAKEALGAYTSGRSTGSYPSTSARPACPRTRGAGTSSGSSVRVAEVITLSSSESSSDEDLEVTAERLRKARCLRKSQRRYTETNKSRRAQVEIRSRIFESRQEFLGKNGKEITWEEARRNTSERGAMGRITDNERGGFPVYKYRRMDTKWTSR